MEQYEIFQEYEILLDENLTEFVTKEGFKSVGACFNEISRLIEEDKEKKRDMWKDIMKKDTRNI